MCIRDRCSGTGTSFEPSSKDGVGQQGNAQSESGDNDQPGSQKNKERRGGRKRKRAARSGDSGTDGDAGDVDEEGLHEWASRFWGGGPKRDPSGGSGSAGGASGSAGIAAV
eukprot:405195-Karenia_brevis.AAC.1